LLISLTHVYLLLTKW